MKEWVTENLFSIITAIFGSGSFFAYITERKKRVIEEKQLASDALKTMQDAYDRFTEDSKMKYEELSSEISELKKKLTNVTSQLQEEKGKYTTLKNSYERLKKSYDSLKREFDNYKKKHNTD